MDIVATRSKHYEQLVISRDNIYDQIVDAINIVKKFITKHGLILYGGSAIDFALRLYGDHIYSDESLATPDLDFYSPDHAEHAYKLCDELFAAGYTQARTIVGIYTRVMKVDIVDNHWIADIAYLPREIFESLPFITYDGMKVIHPDFQRIDIHSSLSLPFSDPPTEVIFARWSKDIARFNMLAKYYPITSNFVTNQDNNPLRKIVIGMDFHSYVFTGFAAYSMTYASIKAFLQKYGRDMPVTIAEAKFKILDENHFCVDIDDSLEFIHYDPNKMMKEISATNVQCYEPYGNLLLGLCTGDLKTTRIHVYNSYGKMLAVNSIEYAANKFRFTNIQFLLKYFLAMSFRHTDRRDHYLRYYAGLMSMIHECEVSLSSLQENERDDAAKTCSAFPSINVYGTENRSLSYDVAIKRIEHDIDGTPSPLIPKYYYVDRSQPHPVFDYSSEIFQESGKIESRAD